MSNKKENTQMSEVFTIDLDQFGDGDIPGVTQLLNPAKMAEKAAAVKAAAEQAAKEAANPSAKAMTTKSPSGETAIFTPLRAQSLKDMFVMFDFQFTAKNGDYCFSEGVAHTEPVVLAWQTRVLTGMKLDLSQFVFSAPFQEYRFETAGILFAAFGIQPQHFMQLVQPHGDNTIHVLVSHRSQAAHKDAILATFAKSSSEGSGKIELDLAS